MSFSACRELPSPRARSVWRAERLGGRPSPPPLATAPCWPMQRDTAGAAPASLRAAGRRPKRPLPSGDPTPRRSRARRECGARAISAPGHAGRSDMGSQAQNIVPNSESAAAAPPPAAAPLTETNSVPPFSPPPPPPPPRPSPPSPPPSISRRRPSYMARAPRSPAPRRCPPLAAAPLVAAASPVNPAVRTTAATASRLAAAAAALPLAAERCLASLLTRGLLHEYMGQKRRKCPKKRVFSSLWQLRSQRGLPGRTARAFGALPGTQGVRLTDQTE